MALDDKDRRTLEKAVEILTVVYDWNGHDRDTDPDVEVLSAPDGSSFTLGELEEVLADLNWMLDNQ
jgi:hypothetical protein